MQLAWGDKLAGVEITPGAWAGGGIVAGEKGNWFTLKGGIAKKLRPGADPADVHAANVWWDEDLRLNCKPIFPPPGWAGKSDAELWAAVWGSKMFPSAPVNIGVGGHRLGNNDCWQVGMTRDGKILLSAGLINPGHSDYGCGCTIEWQELDDPAALILALSNAQLLANRLRTSQQPNGEGASNE